MTLKRKRRSWAASVAIFLLSISGCYFSFQSNQYQMAKGIIDRNKPLGPTAAWTLSWHGADFPAYAVNVKEEVTEEIKTKKQSHMKEFLKDTYEKINTSE